MSESKGPSTEAIALYTNVFGCVPDTEALEAGDVWEIAHIDAALRRAKAEGAREMIKIVKANRADQRVADDLNNTVSFDSFNEVLDAITREADARAAQIEEGE